MDGERHRRCETWAKEFINLITFASQVALCALQRTLAAATERRIPANSNWKCFCVELEECWLWQFIIRLHESIFRWLTIVKTGFTLQMSFISVLSTRSTPKIWLLCGMFFMSNENCSEWTQNFPEIHSFTGQRKVLITVTSPKYHKFL